MKRIKREEKKESTHTGIRKTQRGKDAGLTKPPLSLPPEPPCLILVFVTILG